MLDKERGPSASEAGLQVVSSAAPSMSKSERLHRWADSLELRRQLQLEEIDDTTPPSCGWLLTPADTLTVAFEDWALQAEGLRGDGLGSALAFFDLTESEMQRVIGCADDSGRMVPAASAADRVRALARQAEARRVPHVSIVFVSGLIAAVLGLALVTS